jgi:putative transposase
MILNNMGKIANDEWLKTSELRNNVVLDAFIIMPNHVHGIIVITGKDTGRGVSHTPQLTEFNSHNQGIVNTFLRSPSKTIGAIIRGYKSSVTKKINELYLEQGVCNTPQRVFNPPPQVWQRNYYEHIIRDERSYQNISNYILNNPGKWDGDKFYTHQK